MSVLKPAPCRRCGLSGLRSPDLSGPHLSATARTSGFPWGSERLREAALGAPPDEGQACRRMPRRASSGGAAFCELSRGKDALFAVWVDEHYRSALTCVASDDRTQIRHVRRHKRSPVRIRTLPRHGQLGREPEALGRELAGNASLVLYARHASIIISYPARTSSRAERIASPASPACTSSAGCCRRRGCSGASRWPRARCHRPAPYATHPRARRAGRPSS
jgi:hypothetical protein